MSITTNIQRIGSMAVYLINMSKNSGYHPYQLPENISHWETNFTEMKCKVIDYLKKHTHDQVHPIVDAQHYLILNSHHNTHAENPSLFCTKINKNRNGGQQYDPQGSSRAKQAHFLNYEMERRIDQSHIFRSKCKVSSQNVHGHHCEEDCMRELPPICSLQLERQQRRGQEGPRQTTLKQKLQSGNRSNFKNEPQNEKQSLPNRQRYKSIEQARSKPMENAVKVRANSTFKKVVGDYDRIKTHQQNERNIFFIPLTQYLKQHQQTINSTPISTKTSKFSLQSKEIFNQQPQKIEGNNIKPGPSISSLNPQKAADQESFTPLATTDAKKQLHTGTHRRIYAHAKQHRQQTGVLQKQIFEKFVFSPWQNIREQATIANLDENIDQ